MQIKNPSNKAINDVRIFGVSYSIEAEGTLDNVPEHVARYWQESLHKFLILRKDKLEEKKEEKVEVPEAPIEVPMARIDEDEISEEVVTPEIEPEVIEEKEED